jgi:uncharacterized peroxidase-related enzyme
MARIEPLTEAPEELADAFKKSEEAVGLVTNNLRVMARRPEIVKGLMGLFTGVMHGGTVSQELKYLVGYMASFSSGCMYCSAHSGVAASRKGGTDEKVAAIWEYETNPIFSDAERAALRVAQLAGQVPNGVTDDDFAVLTQHYSDDEIVEIVSAISLYGFFNRFNDTMAMPLEAQTIENAEKTLKPAGWRGGQHI